MFQLNRLMARLSNFMQRWLIRPIGSLFHRRRKVSRQSSPVPKQNLQLSNRFQAFEKALISLEGQLVKLSTTEPDKIQQSYLKDLSWLKRVAMPEIQQFHGTSNDPYEFWRGYDEGKQTRRVFSKQTSEMVYRIKQDYENQRISPFDFGFLVGWRYARIKAYVSRISLLQSQADGGDQDELMTF